MPAPSYRQLRYSSVVATSTTRPLTERQLQIATMFVLDNMTWTEVAATLGLSRETINPTLRAVAAKFGETSISRGVLKPHLEKLLNIRIVHK